MNVVAIVQARLGSTRFPRKIIEDIDGVPMVQRVVERAKLIRGVDEVVVASPDSNKVELQPILKDALMTWGGPENDVLGRYHAIAKRTDADVIMRITADCPLLDPVLSEHVLRTYLHMATLGGFAHNCSHNTDGWDTEVFSSQLLRIAALEADEPGDREHVTPYMRRVGQVKWSSVIGDAPKLSVDTLDELELVRAIYAKLPDGATSREATIKAYHAAKKEMA